MTSRELRARRRFLPPRVRVPLRKRRFVIEARYGGGARPEAHAVARDYRRGRRTAGSCPSSASVGANGSYGGRGCTIASTTSRGNRRQPVVVVVVAVIERSRTISPSRTVSFLVQLFFSSCRSTGSDRILLIASAYRPRPVSSPFVLSRTNLPRGSRYPGTGLPSRHTSRTLALCPDARPCHISA